MSDRPPLEALDHDLWVASRPLRLWIGDIGSRMTVVRSGGDLWLHSPVAIDPALRAAVGQLGRVRWIVGPSLVHHFHLGEWAEAFPEASLVGAPGLPAKRGDLAFEQEIDAAWAPPWGDDLRHHVFRGARRMNEVVFLHRPSRTLVLTDLAFHVLRGGENRARLFHWLVGAGGRFGPHRLVRSFIDDREAARASRDEILGWDFDRVVVSHGAVLAEGGHARFAEAFAFLGPREGRTPG